MSEQGVSSQAGNVLELEVLIRAPVELVWSAIADRNFEPSRPVYSAAGRWLAENTLASASVGYYEIGYLGFHSRRTIVDPLGLVTPAAIPHVAHGQVTWAYGRFRPDYLVQRPDFGKGSFSVREPGIRRSYALVKRFGEAPASSTARSLRREKVRVSIYRRSGLPGPTGE